MEKVDRDELVRLLFSDEAVGGWEDDAVYYLSRQDTGMVDPVERGEHLLHMVGSEVSDMCGGIVDGENDAKDLDSIACTAKRGALLLLYAAAYAETEARRLRAAEGT